MGVDAFRWDTWKHMNKGDIFKLADRFKALNPNLFIFGEVAQKRFELHPVEELNPHWYTWRGATNASQPSGTSVIDFYAEATFHNIFQDGGGFGGVTGAARYDNLYSDPSQLVTWLDNHDFGPNNNWDMRYSGTDENLAACMNFMFTWRGIPSVYYGTEMRFKSGVFTDLHDAAGINQSLEQTGRAYYGDVMNNAPNHIIYKHIKRLNALRKAIPALQNGTWTWAGNAPGNGVGYTRRSGSSFVAVGLAKDGAATFNFTGLDNGTYKDAVTGRVAAVSNGNLSFTVTSGSAGIYVLNGPGMIGENGGFFENCVICASTPVVKISPASGNYNASVTVVLSATGGTNPVSIYYTTDGTVPTATSTKYLAAFSVASRKIVKAIAIDAAGKISDLDGQQYTFELPALSLSASPVTGNFFASQNVTLNVSGGKPPVRVYYTINGTAPTAASTLYTTPIAISSATTIKAIAIDSLGTQTTLTSAYTFIIPPPVVAASPASGNYPAPPVVVTLSATSPKPPVRIYYTTNGTTPTTGSTLYTGSFSVTTPGPKVVKFFGVDSLNNASAVDSVKYTFDPIADMWVYFRKPATWAAAKIHYWNGLPATSFTATTWPGVNMTLHCNDWYKFKFSGLTSVSIIFNDGAGKQTADLSATATAYYDNGWLSSVPNMCGIANTPPIVSISPASSTFSDSIKVTLSVTDDKSGSIIYYTTNGTGATTASTVYSVPFWVKATTTINATAKDSDGAMATTPVSATYTKIITNTPPIVSISPASSTFSDSIKITLTVTDDKSGSIIYYTTNGTGATTASTVYSVPFWVKATTTINATAKDSDGAMATTPVSATYTKVIVNTPPVVSISPVSSTFSDSVKVTVSVTDDKSGSIIYYTNNGTAATTASTVYTAPFWVKATTTINATAKDSDGVMATTPVNATYTKTIPAGNMVVYFENTALWTQPKIYCWSAVPTTYTCSAWPGANMTKVPGCGNWWSYTYTGVSNINLIFNSGTGTQSANLNLAAAGIYNYSWATKLWANGAPNCNTPPVVSINPASSTFSDSIKVTLSVTDDKNGSVIYYTINGTAATTTSTVYTAPFWVKATTTINATAKDSDGAIAATSVSATYTKTVPAGNMVVYFENTGLWVQPKVYCWSAAPATYTCAAWPGVNMTKVANCGNWWSFTFNGVSNTNLIFNSGTGTQSADLNRSASDVYNYSWTSKAWINGAPTCTGAKATATVTNTTTTEKWVAAMQPNPVVSQTAILKIESNTFGEAEIKIIDSKGVVIQLLKKVKIRQGINFISLDVQKAGNGAFVAVVQLESRVLPVKFIVVR